MEQCENIYGNKVDEEDVGLLESIMKERDKMKE